MLIYSNNNNAEEPDSFANLTHFYEKVYSVDLYVNHQKSVNSCFQTYYLCMQHNVVELLLATNTTK